MKLVAAASASICVLAAGAVLLRPAHEPATATTAPYGTATVAKRDLVEREKVAGTIGFAGQRTISASGTGVITRLPPEGSIVRRGEALFEVDGRPVVLFEGERPAWRPLGPGVPDGEDVRQLEQNLKALGHGAIRPDARFDDATAAAVRRWQRALGAPETGTVEPSAAVFGPSEIRVGAHIASPGRPGGDVYHASSTTRAVHVDLDARKQASVAPGQTVRITLPDGTRTGGTVSDVGRVAETRQGANGGGEPTVAVSITLAEPAVAGNLDRAPVSVEITTATHAGVLAVPVNALLALAEGGYALEAIQAGRRRLVAVEAGAFADGYVSVSGVGVREGLVVVTPA